MPNKTIMARIYVEDAAWLHQLRRKISSQRKQDITIADTIRLLREMYEAQNGEVETTK